MRTHTNDRLKGTLDLLVLKTLASKGRMHGFAITMRSRRSPRTFFVLRKGHFTYQPLQQVTRPFFLSHMSYVVRTSHQPQSVAAALRSILHQVGHWPTR
jgi:hypothetical protein